MTSMFFANGSSFWAELMSRDFAVSSVSACRMLPWCPCAPTCFTSTFPPIIDPCPLCPALFEIGLGLFLPGPWLWVLLLPVLEALLLVRAACLRQLAFRLKAQGSFALYPTPSCGLGPLPFGFRLLLPLGWAAAASLPVPRFGLVLKAASYSGTPAATPTRDRSEGDSNRRRVQESRKGLESNRGGPGKVRRSASMGRWRT